MPKLSELLHAEHTRLEAFASHIKNQLQAEILAHQSQHPLYAIKSRIKSFESLHNKLLTSLNSPVTSQADKEHAARFLFEDISLPELFAHCRDIVGIRVIWYFELAKQRMADRLLQNRKKTWFEFLPHKKRKRRIDLRVIPVFDKAILYFPKLSDYREEAYSSGYTGIHITGRLSGNDSLSRHFGDIVFELQIRTLLEEAWSEISHYLEYKGLTIKSTKEELHKAKLETFVIDRTFHDLYASVEPIRNRRLHSHLQLSQNYPLTGKGDIPARWELRYSTAYSLRLIGDFRGSASLLEDIYKSVDIDIRTELRHKVRRRLLGDIAACYLHEKNTPECLDLAANAIERARLQGDDGKDSFWVNLRTAELARVESRYSDAIMACTAAINRLKQPGSVTLCSLYSLEEDVMCYLSHLYFNWSYELMRPPPLGTRNRDLSTRRSDSKFEASQRLADSEKIIVDVLDRIRINPNLVSPEVESRALSHSLLVKAWGGTNTDTNIKNAYERFERIERCGPNDLAKVSWALIVGIVPNKSTEEAFHKAEHYCKSAEALTDLQPTNTVDRLKKRLAVLKRLINLAKTTKKFILPREWLDLDPHG